MEPIVSPWLIYLLSLVDGLLGVLVASCSVLSIIFIVYVVSKIVFYVNIAKVEQGFGYEKRIAAKAKSLASALKLWACVVFPLVVLMLVFIPSKTTIIGMIIAKNVTYENVSKTLSAGKDLKNELKKDVIDIINSITRESKESKKGETK